MQSVCTVRICYIYLILYIRYIMYIMYIIYIIYIIYILYQPSHGKMSVLLATFSWTSRKTWKFKYLYCKESLQYKPYKTNWKWKSLRELYGFNAFWQAGLVQKRIVGTRKDPWKVKVNRWESDEQTQRRNRDVKYEQDWAMEQMSWMQSRKYHKAQHSKTSYCATMR